MLSLDDEELLVWMSYLLIAASLLSFLALQFIAAPYGRYSAPPGQYTVSARISWLVQESPAALLPIFVWGYGSPNPNFANRILIVLFLIHYFHRTFIFSFLIRSSSAVHLYILLPALIVCSYNGYLQSKHLLVTSYPHDWTYSWQFIIGVLLFLGGMCVNIHSDHILRNLRKPGETGYKIQNGGMFEYVSGANYFGEIVEWIGYAIACWSLPAFAFALLTVCNTGPRAVHHHSWYLTKFKDYPRKRKALIPYVL